MGYQQAADYASRFPPVQALDAEDYLNPSGAEAPESATAPVRPHSSIYHAVIVISLLVGVFSLLFGHDTWWLLYHVWNPVLTGFGHAAWWLLYHVWNPVLTGFGHAAWWLLYHVWNPVLTGFGHWLFRVLLAFVAVASIAEMIRTVIETLLVGGCARAIVRRRERRRWLRQQVEVAEPTSMGGDVASMMSVFDPDSPAPQPTSRASDVLASPPSTRTAI